MCEWTGGGYKLGDAKGGLWGYPQLHTGLQQKVARTNCSCKSMEVKLPALQGSYDRPTDRQTDRIIGKLHFQ